MDTISKVSSVPLYLQLKVLIKEKIKKNILKPGDILPSERKMCEIYGVSQITIRQALNELTQKGILLRVPGKGTFVRNPSSHLSTEKAVPLLGLVISKPLEGSTSSFISNLILGIKETISEFNYHLLIFSETESDYLSLPLNGQIKGLILTDPQIGDMRISMLFQKKFPIVIIGRPVPKDIYSVDSDNVWIGYTLTSHLLKRNYKRIAFINSPNHYTVSEDRLTGYKKALKEYQVDFKENLLKNGPFSQENGYKNTKRIFQERPDAIICADDFITMGALSAIKEKGLKVPEDIALLCCNNSSFTQYNFPPLTTIDIFPDQLGKKAAEKLIKLLSGEKPELRTLLRGKLIVRNSSNLKNVASLSNDNSIHSYRGSPLIGIKKE